MLIPVARVLDASLAGFPGEHLLEPNAGAVGRTSAANPFEACFGVVSLKEIVLSSRFSRFFFSVCRGPGRTFYAEAVGFFFERLRHDSRPVRPRQSDELVG